MSIKALLKEAFKEGYNQGFFDMQKSQSPYTFEGDPQAADRWISEVMAEGKIGEVEIPGWISVDDRLPETNKDVLIYDSETGKVNQGCFYGSKTEFNLGFIDSHVWGKPTHWQPLPELPEG